MVEVTKARPSREQAPETMPAREDRAAQIHGERRRRAGNGKGRSGKMRLSIPPHLEHDPNWRYYWGIDRPGRLEQLTKHDDYDFVVDDETAADGRNTGAGTRIERHADVDKFGNPVRHFLLRKPMEYHKADEAEKASNRKKLMDAILRGKTPDQQGNAIHSDGSYVPSQGISITHGDYKP